jgi:hypothetical protein
VAGGTIAGSEYQVPFSGISLLLKNQIGLGEGRKWLRHSPNGSRDHRTYAHNDDQYLASAHAFPLSLEQLIR